MTETFHAQAVLFDVDGTLTNSKGELRAHMSETLTKLEKKKVFTGIITGRMLGALVHYILPLFPAGSIHIISGGAQIIRQDGSILWEKLISNSMTHAIYDNVTKRGGDIDFGSQDYLYGSHFVVERLKNHAWNIQVGDLAALPSWESPLISVVNLNDDVINYIHTLPKETIHVTEMKNGSQISYFDLTSQGVTKGRAVEEWSKITGIDQKHILACGDNINDIEVFDASGYSIAMSHAPDILKEKAHHIASSDDDSALSEMLIKMFDL